MPDHERFERPRQRPARQLRPRVGRSGYVLAPHVPAVPAAVAAHRDNQDGRPPPERFVRQPASHAVTHLARPTAAPAPPILGDDPAGQDGPVGLDALAAHHQAEAVETAERGQIGRDEATLASSVKHVGVFRSGCVGTPIIGRPRPSHADPHPTGGHTLDCEEPENVCCGRVWTLTDSSPCYLQAGGRGFESHRLHRIRAGQGVVAGRSSPCRVVGSSHHCSHGRRCLDAPGLSAPHTCGWVADRAEQTGSSGDERRSTQERLARQPEDELADLIAYDLRGAACDREAQGVQILVAWPAGGGDDRSNTLYPEDEI